MGFLKKFLGSTEVKETKELPWILLTDIKQLDLIHKLSKNKIQIVFKYSTRCGISRIMLNRFVDLYDLAEETADLYYLDIIKYRNISDAIAHRFHVYHESPQVLVIKNEKVIAHVSHSAISNIDFKDIFN